MNIGDTVFTTKCIYETHEDLPKFLYAKPNEELIVRHVHKDGVIEVSHEDVTDSSIYLYPGEYKTGDTNGQPTQKN